jgi:hypothetical protein
VPGSENFQIKRSDNFESWFGKLIKAHYRKNPVAREEFIKLVELILTALELNPWLPRSHSYAWPDGYAVEGAEFRKIEFYLPGVKRGSDAEQGRLLYLVFKDTGIVTVFWIYTHEDFAKRPPQQHLIHEMKK